MFLKINPQFKFLSEIIAAELIKMDMNKINNNNSISSPLKPSISTDAADRWSALRASVSSSSIDTPRMLSQQDFNRHQFASMKATVLTQLPKGKLNNTEHHDFYLIIAIIIIVIIIIIIS